MCQYYLGTTSLRKEKAVKLGGLGKRGLKRPQILETYTLQTGYKLLQMHFCTNRSLSTVALMKFNGRTLKRRTGDF